MPDKIKCSLIEIGNDQRALICIGEGPNGSVQSTRKVDSVDYRKKQFKSGGKVYDFR